MNTRHLSIRRTSLTSKWVQIRTRYFAVYFRLGRGAVSGDGHAASPPHPVDYCDDYPAQGNTLAHHWRYGIHSHIPACCVAWFCATRVWPLRIRTSVKGREWLGVGYVRCHICKLRDRVAIVHTCTRDARKAVC